MTNDPGEFLDQMPEPDGYFDVDTGITEGGVYIRMRNEDGTCQVRLDFDPDSVPPQILLLMLHMFPKAVDTVFTQMTRDHEEAAAEEQQ